MKIFRKIVKKKGQGTIEYILLFAVMSAITITVLKSDKFNQILGQDAEFFIAMKNYMEYSYRHGSPGYQDNSTVVDGGTHELYVNTQTGTSRFFTPVEPYPQ